MKTYLHLCNSKTEDSVMWQIINDEYNLDKDQIFNYTESMYSQLDKENKELFRTAKLKIGDYIVSFSSIDENEVWGKFVMLYLRPL